MANRFWVGGSGTWDNSSTTHWATTSGGASGAAAPTSSDVVIFDGNSGAAAVITVNANVTASDVALGTTGGNFTGTLDFATNNNSPTFSTFAFSGSGTRTLNMGNGTWTITGTSSPWNMSTTTGLTLNANSSTLSFTAVSASTRAFTGGGKTYNIVSVAANSSAGIFQLNGAVTIGTLNITGKNFLQCQAFVSFTITNLNVTGTPGAPVTIKSSSDGVAVNVTVTTGSFTGAAIRDINFVSGAFTASNSLDLGGNTGITVTPPGGLAPAPIVIARGTPY